MNNDDITAVITSFKSEKKIINCINSLGKDIKIIMGDWCIKKQMINFISTPNIGIKRKLNERFDVFNIDEYRTSCLHNKTEEKCDNLYLSDKKINYGNYIRS